MLLPDPTYEGSLGSSSAEMRKVQAVSWGCRSVRSVLLSISSKGASPLLATGLLSVMLPAVSACFWLYAPIYLWQEMYTKGCL